MIYIIIYLLWILGILTNFALIFIQFTYKFYKGDIVSLVMDSNNYIVSLPLISKLALFFPINGLLKVLFISNYKLNYSNNWKFGEIVNNSIYEIKNVEKDLYEIRWTGKLVAYKHRYEDINVWFEKHLSYVTVEKEKNNLLDIKKQFVNKFKNN